MRNTTTVVIAAGLVLAAVTVTQAATIFVDAGNCPGPGDGSVGDPYCSIQDAIDNAVDTDEIVVAQGEYFENINFNGKAISLRSTDPDDPVVVMATIINGGGVGSVVICDSGEGSDTVLTGFVITGGQAGFGGGMFIFLSSPTVTNCTFIGNSADNLGGGMYNSGSSPTVTNTGFCNNTPDAIAGDPIMDGGGNSLLYCGPPIPIPDTCPADIDNDGNVGILDFLGVLAAWGPCP